MDYPRFNNWQDRLDAYIAKHERQPFNWHKQNCSTFAAGWVTEATGRVIEVPLTQSAIEACRAVQSLGGLFADACRQLGEPIAGTMARCGDVVLLSLPGDDNEPHKAFGVCLGAVVAAQGREGLLMLPVTGAEAAWRV